MNDFYQDSGSPATRSLATSSTMRAEFAAIELGFDKLPALTGNGSKIIAVNSGASALEAITTTGTGSGVRATSPTLVTPVLGVAAGTSLSLSGQLTSTLATGTPPLVIASTTLVSNLYVARAALADAMSASPTFTGTITFPGTTIINSTGIGVGISPTVGLQILGAPVTNNDARYNIIAQDPTAFALGVGGGIVFRAKHNTAGAYVDAGNIKGIKENATDGNFAGALSFVTHVSGGNPTEKMRITSDGRIYGTALHNNAGAVTGTTNHYIASGTYTPTVTNIANVTASGTTGRMTSFIRIGNVVHCAGQLDVNYTASAAITQYLVSLPIPSNFTTGFQSGGCAVAVSSGGWAPTSISADATNDALFFECLSTDNGTATVTFSFSYEVL